MPVAVYPGSFNPPTTAHLAVARAAIDQAGADRVDLAVSRAALGKEHVDVPSIEDRMAVLAEVAATRPWLGARLVEARLLADIAEGYDLLVVGADKWAQLLDPAWYGGPEARDQALARLPRVLVVDRPPHPAPPDDPRWARLTVDPRHGSVSSSAARAGRAEWMLPEAQAWDARWGGWSDPARYLGRRGGT